MEMEHPEDSQSDNSTTKPQGRGLIQILSGIIWLLVAGIVLFLAVVQIIKGRSDFITALTWASGLALGLIGVHRFINGTGLAPDLKKEEQNSKKYFLKKWAYI